MPITDQAPTVITASEQRSLVTVEVTERLIARAVNLLDSLVLDEAGDRFGRDDFREALRLLVAATDETTSRTCTAVKNLALSDAIAAEARSRVSRIVAAK